MKQKFILSIDLKSFFASCECIDRGLDPFNFSLAVASKTQGNGAITLAITPYLKNQGVKSRSRLYEIPNYIKYTIVEPRMGLYIDYSKKVVDVYKEFVSEDDLYQYSIDECFLDITNYLNFYNKSASNIAQDILNRITEKTGLTATCGIGPNIFIAKVAMDTEAKKFKNGIADWSNDNYLEKLSSIKKLSSIWGIGPKMEKKLNNIGIFSAADLKNYDQKKLTLKLGVLGNEMHNLINGIDNRTIASLKEAPKDKSFSISQALYNDYYEEGTKIVTEEMAEVLSARLRKANKSARTVNYKITYSRELNKFFNKSMQLAHDTNKAKDIYEACMFIFDQLYENLPIRKIEIHLFGINECYGEQLDIFSDVDDVIENKQINDTIDTIKNKFGKASINKASSLLSESNINRYNKKNSK